MPKVQCNVDKLGNGANVLIIINEKCEALKPK